MGYTRDSPQWQEMVDTMVNVFTLEQCKYLKQRYWAARPRNQLGVEQVEEAMRIRVRKGIDPWDPDEVKSRVETRHMKLVDGKYVEYIPLQSDFGAMHACLARM